MLMTIDNPAPDNTTRLLTGMVLLCGLLVGACSQSAKSVAPTTVESDKPLVSGAPEISRIKAKGGTKIDVLVNKRPITTNQIKRRAAFVRLRRMKGNATTIARNELIDEAVKLQEARRLGAVASDAEVSRAYAGFAKSNKMSVSTLDRMLAQSGVTKRGFQNYVRASLSWQRMVAARIQRQAASTPASTTQSWLPEAGTSSSKATEYTILQIVFIVPSAKRNSLLTKRRVEAKRYRAQLNGCTNARELAKGLKDVTILDRGRLLEAELPRRWTKEIKATAAGKVTRVKDYPKGVEMIVVCKTREVIGQANGIDANILSGGDRAPANKVSKEYLEQLKARAVIQRR